MKLFRSHISNWQDISSRFTISLLYSVSKERFHSVIEQRGNLGGHAIAKKTGHWFLTENVQVQSQLSACGICDGQVSLQVIYFSCRSPFHWYSILIHLSSRAGIIGLVKTTAPRYSGSPYPPPQNTNFWSLMNKTGNVCIM